MQGSITVWELTKFTKFFHCTCDRFSADGGVLLCAVITGDKRRDSIMRAFVAGSYVAISNYSRIYAYFLLY